MVGVVEGVVQMWSEKVRQSVIADNESDDRNRETDTQRSTQRLTLRDASESESKS